MIINDDLLKYSENFTSDESTVLAELREHCYTHFTDSSMLSGFFQGRVLSMLSHMIRPKVVLEIGTYLGYSALCLAEGLAEDGKVITIDVEEETNRVAKSYVARTEYASKIEFVLGTATEFIPTLSETFDLVFIDADKPNYSNYDDLVIDRMSDDGFIIADNVLWSGKVLLDVKDEDTRGLYEFSQKVMADDRVENVLLPIRDGLMIIRRRTRPQRNEDSIPVYELSV
jgi:predicted O-methyltransferase YrrM